MYFELSFKSWKHYFTFSLIRSEYLPYIYSFHIFLLFFFYLILTTSGFHIHMLTPLHCSTARLLASGLSRLTNYRISNYYILFTLTATDKYKWTFSIHKTVSSKKKKKEDYTADTSERSLKSRRRRPRAKITQKLIPNGWYQIEVQQTRRSERQRVPSESSQNCKAHYGVCLPCSNELAWFTKTEPRPSHWDGRAHSCLGNKINY